MTSSSVVEWPSGIERIDSDLWAQRATLTGLATYLDVEWREYLRLSADGTPSPFTTTHDLPQSGLWQVGKAVEEAACHPDPVALTREYLDREGIDLSVLNPGVAAALSAIASPYYAATVAKAVNDWTAAWLDADPRFLGSIVVSPADGELAAAEVERAASNERMVQVLLAYPRRLLGHRALDPLFEVAAAHGLPINFQSGGAFAGGNRGIAGVGHPTSVFEYELEWIAGAQPHLVSMICEGVFERHPRLMLVVSGFGAAWVPSLLWGMDAEFRSGRTKPPAALTQLPSEVVREHVRFTSSPLEAPERAADFAALLALFSGEQLLLFGSGRPRGDEKVYTAAFESLPEESRRLVFCDNARALYRTTDVAPEAYADVAAPAAPNDARTASNSSNTEAGTM